MKQRGKTFSPRNPYAMAASHRKAGAHGKNNKTKRRDARLALQRAVRDKWEEAFFPDDEIIFYASRFTCLNVISTLNR